MPLPPKAYYRLSEAAELLGCSIYDLIHWAVNGHTRLGVLYSTDGFYPDAVKDLDEGRYKDLFNYSGFAYVDRGYLHDAEGTGRFGYTTVVLPDGRLVEFKPYPDRPPVREATIDELFIHDAEFKILEGQWNLLAEETARRTAERNRDLQQAANQLVNEWKQRGRKVLSKREVAVALAKSDAWQDMTAARIVRLIRVEW